MIEIIQILALAIILYLIKQTICKNDIIGEKEITEILEKHYQEKYKNETTKELENQLETLEEIEKENKTRMPF